MNPNRRRFPAPVALLWEHRPRRDATVITPQHSSWQQSNAAARARAVAQLSRLRLASSQLDTGRSFGCPLDITGRLSSSRGHPATLGLRVPCVRSSQP